MNATQRQMLRTSLIRAATIAVLSWGTMAPSVSADHLPEGRLHIDFAAVDIIVPDLVLDQSNAIGVSVSNYGTDEGTGVVRLFWNPASGTGEPDPAALIGASPVSLPAGGSETFEFEWEGRDFSFREVVGSRRLVAMVENLVGFDDDSSNDRRDEDVFIKRLVVDVEIDGSVVRRQTVAPGATAAYDFTVANLGNVKDRVRLSISDTEPGWDYSLLHPELTLAAGQVSSNQLRVTPPSTASMNHESVVTITATSASAEEVADVDASAPTRVGRRAAVAIGDVPSADGGAGTSLLIPVQVSNPGNGPDTFRLERTSGPPGWTFSFEGGSGADRVTVPAGQSRPLQLRVTIPAAAEAGTYLYSIGATSQNDTSAFDEVSSIVTVRQDFAVRLTASPSDVAAEPGAPADFIMTVTNTGNGRDTFRGLVGLSPAEWSVTFQPATLTLARSGDSGEIQARVTPAPGTNVGDYSVTLRARSEFSSSTQAEQRVSVRVPPAYGVRIAASPANMGFKADQTQDFQFQVENLGNQPDRVSIAVQPSNESGSGWTYKLVTPSFDLAPRALGTGTIRVTSPSSVPVGERLELIVTGTSQGNVFRQAQVQLNATARAVDLVVESMEFPPVSYAGEKVTLKMRVRNVGDLDLTGADNFFDVTPSVQQVSQSATVGEPSVVGSVVPVVIPPLRAGESKTVSLAVNTTSLAGGYRMFAYVDAKHRIAETNDEARGTDNNQMFVDIEIRVLKVTILAPVATQAGTGQLVRLEGPSAFRIRNDGATAESLTLEVKAPPGWPATIQGPTIDLGPAEEQSLIVHVQVPDEVAGVMNASVEVVASIEGRPGLARNASTRIAVRDDEPPSIVAGPVEPLRADVGTPVTLRAYASDNVALALVQAMVTRPDSQTVLLPMASDSGDDDPTRYEVATAFALPGNYSATFEAVDAQGNKASTTSTAVTFVLDATGSISILPSGWQDGARIRAGPALSFAVSASGDIHEAFYRMDDTKFLFTATDPYEIATAGLVDGTHELYLYLLSTTGARFEETFGLTVDNVPPQLEKVSLSPSRPASGQTVEVLVQVRSNDTARVAVLVTEVGAPPTAHEAQRLSSNEFRAAFVARGSLQSVQVVLEDDLGNTAVANPPELLALLDVPAGGKSPGAGLGLAIVGIGALAVAARRGRCKP